MPDVRLTARVTVSVTVRVAVRVAIVLGLLAGVAHAAVASIDVADVDTTARRDVAFGIGASCDLTTVEALAARHPGVRQFVVVQSAGFGSTSGTLEVAARTAGGAWRCQRGPRPARLGREGTRPLVERRSGDDTTPAGVFPLGVVTAWDGQQFSIFGNRSDPGVLAPYRDVRIEDCWGATENTARYQHVVARPYCPGPADEWLRGFGDVYSHAAVIGANLDPISGDQPGETPYAAAIFLHRHSYGAGGATKPTRGCVSLDYEALVDTVRLLDPRLAPHFAIGPTDWLRASG